MDSPEKLSQIGAKVAARLAEEKQINSIADLKKFKNCSAKEIETQAKVKGISVKALAAAINDASTTALPGARPQAVVVDHRKADNPYLSLHGENWKEKVRNTTTMKKSMCINTLVKKIYASCEKVFDGTTHELDWRFYHDALSLMTADECRKFMAEEGIINRWILPENGLNAGTIYEGRPVGNCPEIMPLDCNLNKDCHEGAKRQILYTNQLDKDDPRKFSLKTPKQGADTYRRLWDRLIILTASQVASALWRTLTRSSTKH